MKKRIILFALFLLCVGFGSTSVLAADLPQITGTAHVQDQGWSDYQSDGNHIVIGTVGQARRIEAFTLNTNYPGLGLTYDAHVENIGWQSPVNTNEMAGTTGQALRVEAIHLNLTGENASNFTVYYRAHVENYGWLDWAQNGRAAGTSNHAYRCEAFEILIVPAGTAAPGSTTTPAVEATSRAEATHMILVNMLRKNHGLNLLSGSYALKAVADYRLREIPINATHTRPNGLSYETAVKDVFPNYPTPGGGIIESFIYGRLEIALPANSFSIYSAYPHMINIMLDPGARYMSWSGMTHGTSGYAIELFSGLDDIDFANY